MAKRITIEDMKIKAIAPWFGGKRQAASAIVKIIGEHKSYWEPFCGSMAVLFAKPKCGMETVNDLHGDLVNLARVLQDPELGLQLYERAHKTLYSEALFRDAKDALAQPRAGNAIDVDRAYNYFVMSWLGINGVSGTKRCDYQFAMRWCLGGGQGATRWQAVTKSIPAWHSRLRNVVILNRDAFGLLENIKDEPGAVIYCDPPYLKVGSKYLHGFSDEKHGELEGLLKRFKNALVIVSYYDHPKISEIYAAWYKTVVQEGRQSMRNASRAPISRRKPKDIPNEIILTNRMVEAEEPDPGLFEERNIDDETDEINRMESELNA